MAKSLVALSTVAVLGSTLTTSDPAAAQAWLLPVIAGSFATGAFVGAAASPYPYYSPYSYHYFNGYNGYGYSGYGYNDYYNGYSCQYHCGPYYPAYYGGYGQPYYPGYGASSPTVVIVMPHY
jgi:hypothetical protein